MARRRLWLSLRRKLELYNTSTMVKMFFCTGFLHWFAYLIKPFGRSVASFLCLLLASSVFAQTKPLSSVPGSVNMSPPVVITSPGVTVFINGSVVVDGSITVSDVDNT